MSRTYVLLLEAMYLQAGWGAGMGAALGSAAALVAAPAKIGSGFQLLLGSAAGGALFGGLLSAPERTDMERMEDGMDAMFLASILAAGATAVLLPVVLPPAHPARHHLTMVIMDALMGGMVGGGAGAWWPPVRLPKLVVWIRSR